MMVYLDSVILVYFFDHSGEFLQRAARRLATLRAAGDGIAVSDLVRMECRMDPLRHRDAKRLARFDTFFARDDVDKIPITTAVFDRATQIRAIHGYKAIDALNLATAVEGGCEVFLTNDLKLRSISGLTVEVLP